MRVRSGILLLVVVAVAVAGCTPFGNRRSALAHASKMRGGSTDHAPDSSAGGWMNGPVVGGMTGPPEAITKEEAMAKAAPDLARLAQADPELHAEVLDQIAGSPPSVWQETVQSAIGRLEYRQQLGGAEPTAIARREATPTDQPSPQQSPPETSPTQQGVVQATAIADPTPTPTPNSAAPDPPLPTIIPNRHAYDASKPLRISTTDAPAAVIANPHVASAAGSTLQVRPVAPTPTAQVLAEADWRTHLGAAIEAFERDAPLRPRTAAESRARLRARLMNLAAGESERAVAPIPGLIDSEQSYWSSQMWAMATLLDDSGSSDPMVRADAAARHQGEASAQLRSMGSLQVKNLAAVREVYGFGAYEPIRNAAYAPGDRALLYAEIDHYTSNPTPEGYRTALKSSYRLLDVDGVAVASGDFPVDVDDLCLSQRRDFYIQYALSLPADLREGDYRLELTVTDRLGDKTGGDELSLRIARR